LASKGRDFSLLNSALVLVAEDEPFIALDIAFAIEDAGGEVVGPAASVEEALALIEARSISGAILDVNLTDGDITPVAQAVLRMGIPVILQSGIGLPPEFAARFPEVVFHMKPCVAATLVTQLAQLILDQQRAVPPENKNSTS
jgi:DNA-binding NtrC family response regulator